MGRSDYLQMHLVSRLQECQRAAVDINYLLLVSFRSHIRGTLFVPFIFHFTQREMFRGRFEDVVALNKDFAVYSCCMAVT